jgi:putative sterol carrier protein
VEQALFPLDEELGLLVGRYTPRLQETIARWGSDKTFGKTVKEVGRCFHTAVSEATCRRVTYRSGEAAEAITRLTVEELEKEAADPVAAPETMLVSADGSFIRLTTGEWREVKSVAVGEFGVEGPERTGKQVVKTTDISYFTRSYGVRDFERYALAELHRRGLEKAKTVVAVNDGAAWIQSFIDYHCPQAVRIIDFAHALGYVADAGKAIWGEESDNFKGWFSHMSHQLKRKPPQQSVADLGLLHPKAKSDEQEAVLDCATRYLQTRLEMIDYPYFQNRGYPIGSGSVESAHKLLVQERMKGAGMRWAEHHIDPMLALRDFHCSNRWEEGWSHIVAHQQRQRHLKQSATREAQEATSAEPLTFAKLKAAGLLSEDKVDVKESENEHPYRPGPDHPWRNDKWPTKESWRWI